MTSAKEHTVDFNLVAARNRSLVMPQYKLTYFQLRGKAEAIRMTFSVAGVEFEDVRVSIDDWVTKLKHCECATLNWFNPTLLSLRRLKQQRV